MESTARVGPTGVAPLDQRPSAAAWRRVLARVLDALTVFFILWALAVIQVLWFIGDLSREISPSPWGRALVPTLLFAGCLLLHEAYFVRNNQGQTPGMDVCGIRVIGKGGELSWSRCLWRATPAAVLWIVPPLWVAAALVAGTGLPALAASGSSLQDRLARTRVVPYDRTVEDPNSPPVPSLFAWRRLARSFDDEEEETP